MIRKAANVLVPYLLLSCSFIALYFFLSGEVRFPYQLHQDPTLNNLYATLANLLTGRTLTAYWYIPFVILIFALSPVFIRFLTCSPRTMYFVTAGAFVVAFIVNRPPFGLNPIHSLVYFLPFYLFGMLYSIHRDAFESWLERYRWPLVIALVLCLAVMAILGQEGNIEKWNPFTWQGLDLMPIQKVLLIMVLLSFLLKIKDVPVKPLTYLANVSFAIYFIHPWILFILMYKGVNRYLEGGFGFAVRAVVVVLVAVVCAEVCKWVLRSRSRFIIGY